MLTWHLLLLLLLFVAAVIAAAIVLPVIADGGVLTAVVDMYFSVFNHSPPRHPVQRTASARADFRLQIKVTGNKEAKIRSHRSHVTVHRPRARKLHLVSYKRLTCLIMSTHWLLPTAVLWPQLTLSALSCRRGQYISGPIPALLFCVSLFSFLPYFCFWTWFFCARREAKAQTKLR